jgi:hypothetical protein
MLAPAIRPEVLSKAAERLALGRSVSANLESCVAAHRGNHAGYGGGQGWNVEPSDACGAEDYEDNKSDSTRDQYWSPRPSSYEER